MDLSGRPLQHLRHLLFILPLLSLCIGCGGRHSRISDSAQDDENIETAEKLEVTVSNHPLSFKLYMERSGSMISYDTKDSKGDFKKIVSSLLNRFPELNRNDTSSVYIVNDDVYPYDGSVKDFLAQRDFFSSTQNFGNPSYTDFDKIFEMILADTKKYQVSALVTDMIYSVRGQEDVTPSKLLNEAYALTHNVFKGNTKTSVIVLKFEADYNGPYYPYNSPVAGISYSGDRPFYVMLFASKDSMEELYNTGQYKEFTHFSDLTGYENMFTFTNMKFDPQYSIVMGYSHEGTYGKMVHGKATKTVKGIRNAQLAKKGDKIEIPIAIDLSSIPLSNDYKKQKDYYEIQSGAGYKIKSIESVDNLDNGKDEIVKEALPSATHLLILETDQRPQNEKVNIKLAYSLPGWIRKASSADDSNLKDDNFSDTTFGFEEVMKGIYEAYVPAGSRRYLFDIGIEVSKK